MPDRAITTRFVFHLTGDSDAGREYHYSFDPAFEQLAAAYVSNNQSYRELRVGHILEILEFKFKVEEINIRMWREDLGQTSKYPFNCEVLVGGEFLN
jgi:hypothetical protein